MSRLSFPIVVRKGSVSVKVYRVNRPASGDRPAREVFTTAWIAEGRRRTTQHASLQAAKDEASLKAEQLAAGRIEGATMGRSDRDELQAARALAGTTPLISALQEWANARSLTGGQVTAAAEAWAARNLARINRQPVREVVSRFLKAKTAAGIQTAKNHNRLFEDLKADFGDASIDSITAPALNAWLAQREHPSTRNTYRKHIVALWRWAQKQGFLPRDVKTEAEQTDRAAEAPHEIGIISASTYADLLNLFRSKHPEYLGPLVLAGFCGLRRAEVHAQLWDDIALERGHLRVTKGKRGTPSRRIVTLEPAAISWLRLCRSQKGPVCSNLALDRIRNIGRDAGFELPENCFRHSFVSHRVAKTGDVNSTALEAGNSPSIIFKHYRELVTKEEGETWFTITPDAQDSKAS